MLIHQLSLDETFATLRSSPSGLSRTEALERRREFGANRIERLPPTPQSAGARPDREQRREQFATCQAASSVCRGHPHGDRRGPSARGTARLAAEGIDAEVIDLRTLCPLDMDTVLASVRKTRRIIVVDEGWRSGGLAAEILARVAESAFYDLDAPVGRVCSAEVPIPYPKHLEDAAIPQPERIVAAVRALMPTSVSSR